MKKDSFVCEECGKTHEGIPTDWSFKLPDNIFILSFLDRYRRTRSNSDLCALDEKRFFIRCTLSIPFTHKNGEFVWGCWMEVAKNYHDFYLDNYDNQLAGGTKLQGTLANGIPGYADLTGIVFDIELQSGQKRPEVTFPAGCEHELALLQRSGMDDTGHHNLLTEVGYFKEQVKNS